MVFVDEANTEAYRFWREKVRARIDDPILKEKFAPMVKPRAFVCKRISLEHGLYELFNKPNVHLVDMREMLILEVTPNGIKTSEGKIELDYIVCATGFDAITVGILVLNIEGRNGIKLKDKWNSGIKTNLGMAVTGFPNMFFTYGPNAPIALGNGPSCAELQGEWIVGETEYMREKKFQRIEGTKGSEEAWAAAIWNMANASLLPTTRSASDEKGDDVELNPC